MPVTTVDNWQYAEWVQAVGRNLRINPATAAELTAANLFVTQELAKRPWLSYKFDRIGTTITGQTNNNEVVGEKIYAVGRDMNKIQLIDNTEKGYCDTLFTATGNRKWGDASTGPRGTKTTGQVVL